MSTGGIFQLITNDGKQDRMLMASQLLMTRLVEIRRMRSAAGVRDPTPTLVDIERTHVLFMNAHFKPFAAIGYEYNKVRPQSGSAIFGSTIQFSIPQFGDFFNDMALHLKISATSAVDNENEDNADNGKFQYADFLAHKLAKKVKFSVNGNPLDEYGTETQQTHYSFYVKNYKQTGYKRNVGQEVANKGFFVDAVRDIRECLEFKCGAQTPKTNHDEIEIWLPLLFWFNTDPRLAIPSVSIPYGQRFIDVELATLAEITCGDEFDAPEITDAELYINNIFVNPEIHDIFIKRIGFNLIRVHRIQSQEVTRDADMVLLNNIKWPVETMYVCFRPDENKDDCEDWHRCHLVNEIEVCRPWVIDPPDTADPESKQLVSRRSSFKKCIPLIETLGVEAHGIKLYDNFPASFYNSYIPYIRGPDTVTPEDCGRYMITFNLYPGAYQPSGHVNVSRAREFYLNYTAATLGAAVGGRPAGSKLINEEYPACMAVIAICINFLLISDGSAVLRYST